MGIAAGLTAGLAAGLDAGLAAGLAPGLTMGFAATLAAGLAPGLAVGFAATLAGVTCVGLAAWLALGIAVAIVVGSTVICCCGYGSDVSWTLPFAVGLAATCREGCCHARRRVRRGSRSAICYGNVRVVAMACRGISRYDVGTAVSCRGMPWALPWALPRHCREKFKIICIPRLNF